MPMPRCRIPILIVAAFLPRLPRYTSYRGRYNNERRQRFHRQASKQPGAVAAFCLL